MKFCSNCGKEWQEGSKFCAYCGAKGDSVDTTQQPQSQFVQQPAQPQQVPPAQPQQVPPMQTQQQVPPVQTQQQIPPIQPQQQIPPIQPQQQYNTNQQTYNAQQMYQAQQQFNGYGQPQNLPPLTDIDKLDLGMIENFKQCVTKIYAKFDGRASRAEYWRFLAATYALFGILSILFVISGVLGAIVLGIVYLAIIIPCLALGVRRLHDINKSGWYLLVSLIPFVGGIWLIVLMATKGDEDINQYGYRTGFIPVTEDIKRQYNLADTTQSTGIVVLTAIIGMILIAICTH